VLLHSFLASRAVAVMSGGGVSGSALVIGVGGAAMVNGVAVGHGAHCHVSASSASWVVVAACLECISPYVSDASHHRCSVFRGVVGDCGSVSLGLLLGAHFLLPAGFRTMSNRSWMSRWTSEICRDISSTAEEVDALVVGDGGQASWFGS
jgi:hypothetical protein